MQELCQLLSPMSRRTEESTLSSLDLSIDDVVWICQRLREYFIVSENNEKQKLLSILPTHWGRDRIAKWFSASPHLARHSIEQRTLFGPFTVTSDSRGNKKLDSNIEQAVLDFYICEEISRETSYKKQVIRSSSNLGAIPLRYLHLTVEETFAQFKMKHPNIQISRSKFFSLRPSWVREKVPHETCLCIYHENADLLLQVNSRERYFNQSLSLRPYAASKSLMKNVTMKELLSRSICSSSSESCFYRQCDQCHRFTPSHILCQDANIDLEDSVSWSVWKKVGPRYELVHLTSTLGVLMEEIDELWPHFITHSFYTSQQRDYISLIRNESSRTTFIVVQIDFAQNFSFVIQREVQSAYFNRQQATVFTVHMKIGEEHRNMAIISDYLAHDTKFVYSAIKTIVQFIKREYPNVEKIHYVSDGATAHFKSQCTELVCFMNPQVFEFVLDRFNICNLACHQNDFSLRGSWAFTATGHGKGPCDGIGAVVKSTATQYLLRGGPQASFSSPKHFYEWCARANDRMVIARSNPNKDSIVNKMRMSEPNRPIEIRWLSAVDFTDEYENVLLPRWNSLSARNSIPRIRDQHHFDAETNGLIVYRRVSRSIETFTQQFPISYNVPPSLTDVSIMPNFAVGDLIVIEYRHSFILAHVELIDLTIYQMRVSCFDPPFPASSFTPSNSPNLKGLTTSTGNFMALVRNYPPRMSNGRIQLTPSQISSIKNILDVE